MPLSANLTAVPHQVTTSARERRYGHAGAVIWLTGLSASGKSTLAMGLEERLLALGYATYTLDGDNVRHGLNANLGFSPDDRMENIRRVGEVAALFSDAGLICIAAFISPYRQDRLLARRAAHRSSFHEVYVAADLAICEARDPKGLYRKARDKELCNFTGIDATKTVPHLRVGIGQGFGDGKQIETLGCAWSRLLDGRPGHHRATANWQQGAEGAVSPAPTSVPLLYARQVRAAGCGCTGLGRAVNCRITFADRSQPFRGR